MIVYPVKATALNVVHPTGVKLKSSGSEWPADGFTFRMIVQDIATEDQAKAFTGDAASCKGKDPKPDDPVTMHYGNAPPPAPVSA